MHIFDKLLWDLPVTKRQEIKQKLNENPVEVFRADRQLFVKALNSFTWYELIGIFGPTELQAMITDDVLNKIFPRQRSEYYKNARRLLSTYSIPPAG